MEKFVGFTLVELMVVVAVIIIVASMAIPALLRARIIASEASAIGCLRTLSSAQEAFRASCIRDQDLDGQGEYATLSMLAAASPGFIDMQFGMGVKSGYMFDCLLGSAAGGVTGIDGSESAYFGRAMPRSYPRTGNRCFVVDASGVIRGSDIGPSPSPQWSTACDLNPANATLWPPMG